jgi:hypothetical protein
MTLLQLFKAKTPHQLPQGEYALSLAGQYYTGRAYEGEPILNPDPAMACTMTLEQAHAKRQYERFFSGFAIVPMGQHG